MYADMKLSKLSSRRKWTSYRNSQSVYCVLQPQVARQGLAVLMAFAVVVLKLETSTLRQRHNFVSIDFKFGVGDNVREVTNPDKVGSGPMSGRDAT